MQGTWDVLRGVAILKENAGALFFQAINASEGPKVKFNFSDMFKGKKAILIGLPGYSGNSTFVPALQNSPRECKPNKKQSIGVACYTRDARRAAQDVPLAHRLIWASFRWCFKVLLRPPVRTHTSQDT